MEARLLMTGGGPTYSDHVNFDGLEFAVIGSPIGGPRFQAGNVGGQAVKTVTGATVAVGKEVSDADFASGFVPLLFLNGTAEPGSSNASGSVTLDTTTAATSTTVGNAHGEFSTTGDIEGYYAGGYHAIVGSGGTNTLYVGELTSPGGDSLSNAGGLTVGFGGIGFNVSNFGIDTSRNALTMKGSASIKALSTSNTHFVGTASASIDTSGIHLDALNGSISMAANQSVSAAGVELTNGVLAVGYSAEKSEIDLAGTVTVGTETPVGTERGPTLTATLGALNADNTIKTPGIAIVNGSLMSLNGSVSSTSTFRAAGLTFTPESLGVSYNFTTHDLAVDGRAKIAWGSGSDAGTIDLALGNASTGVDGLVISGGRLQSLNGSVDADFSLLGLTYKVNQLTVGFQAGVGLEVYGGVSITNNSPGTKTFNNLAAQLGTAASPGIVVRGGTLTHLDVTVDGAFQLYGVDVAADGLNVVYDAAASTLDLSGSVDVSLTDAIQGSVILADRGITINTATGAVSLNNLELKFNADFGAFKLKNLDIKYATSGAGYSVSGTVQVVLPGTGAVIAGGLEIVDDRLKDIRLSYDAGSGNGIPLGQTQIYLSHIGGELDNLNNVANLSVNLSAGITVGPSWTIKGTKYAALTAVGSITVTANFLEIAGNVQVVSAGTTSLLGSGSGDVMLNWQTHVYNASADLSIYGGVFRAHGDITLTGSGDLTINAKAGVQVPGWVPWIGGENIASANFYLQVRPEEPASDTYAKAWVSTWFGTAGIEYNADSGFDYFLGDPGIPSTTTRSGAVYSTGFSVGFGATNETVLISDPAFKDPNFNATLARSTIVVYRTDPSYQVIVPPVSLSLGSYPSFSQNGPISLDPSHGTLTFSLQSLFRTSSIFGAPLPLGGVSYSVFLVTPPGAPLLAPTFQEQTSYPAPSLSVGYPSPSPSTVVIPINATSYDPNSNPTISLFDANSADAGTSANDDEGTLIATIPLAYYQTTTTYGGNFVVSSTQRVENGTLYLPNGYVTYRNYLPASFTWTTYPETAVPGSTSQSYVYGLIDDGENTPARSPQTWNLQPAADPSPQLGAVAPITSDFSRPVYLPVPSLSEPGLWPIAITVTDVSGYATILSRAGSGTSVTYTTGTADPVGDASRFLSNLWYDLPLNISTGQPAPGFPGHDEVTIDVTTLVGPDHIPFTTERTIDLGRPNADLVVGQTATGLAHGRSGPTTRTQSYVTLTVTNRQVAGSEVATGVAVMDSLPPGATAQVAPGSTYQGTFDPTTGKWSVGTLAVGQTATLTLLVTYPVVISPVINVLIASAPLNAIVATSDQPDLYPSDAVGVLRLPNPNRGYIYGPGGGNIL